MNLVKSKPPPNIEDNIQLFPVSKLRGFNLPIELQEEKVKNTKINERLISFFMSCMFLV